MGCRLYGGGYLTEDTSDAPYLLPGSGPPGYLD